MPTSEPPPWIKKMREGAKERALENARKPPEPAESIGAAIEGVGLSLLEVLIVWPFRILLGLLRALRFIFVLLLLYGVIVIIFKYAFDVHLWNPFG
jgi:hypothetical protein